MTGPRWLVVRIALMLGAAAALIVGLFVPAAVPFGVAGALTLAVGLWDAIGRRARHAQAARAGFGRRPLLSHLDEQAWMSAVSLAALVLLAGIALGSVAVIVLAVAAILAEAGPAAARARRRRQGPPTDTLAGKVAARMATEAELLPRDPQARRAPEVAAALADVRAQLEGTAGDVRAAALWAYADGWNVARTEDAAPPGDVEEASLRHLAGIVRFGGAGLEPTIDASALLLWATVRGYVHGRTGQPGDDLPVGPA